MEKNLSKYYIPKKITQQELYLQKYPSYDGRGLKIAIIDSGVDVSLEGLQKTSTGLPKIMECFDYTGAGDVDTTTVKKIGKDNTLILLSGRKVKIPDYWKNPSNKWHLGIKPMYEIQPQKPDHIKNLACCVRIHDSGNFLELFIPRYGHGSGVAQVAAAHFPGQPEKDGLAPGAQIISMSISNTRTGMARMEKAISKCIELGIDVVNFSISSSDFCYSTIIDMIKKMVNEHGIIVTKSAGNYGPFFSSIGDDTSEIDDLILSIGAVSTKDTMCGDFQSDFKDCCPLLMCNYSSKGPISNGARGVTLCAPADAIIENPKWHPSKKSLFYGTSSAAPNAAGAIACLLSGLKANSITYSPAMIKMALSNTALLPDGGDRLGFGNGIIQIYSAFEYLITFHRNLTKTVFPRISINETSKKGIIIYKTIKDENIFNYCINVKYLIAQTRKAIPWSLKLLPESHNNFVEYSKIVENNLFNVKIDTTNLKPGNIYYSEIHGFDPTNFLLGPMFYLPITIVFPENFVNHSIQKEIFIEPPSILKLILDLRNESQKCTLKIINPENGKTEFEKGFEKSEKEDFIKSRKQAFIPKGSLYEWKIDVRWSKTFEICIYKDCYFGDALKRFLQIDFF